MIFLVYGLIDPRTLLIRYVGKSSTGMTRPRQHRYSSKKSYCSSWVRSLLAAGLDYGITVLQVCTSDAELIAAERWWIAYGRLLGWPLTNLTDGGEGLPLGFKFRPGVRGGWIPSEAHRQKISAALRGRTASDEAKHNMSIAQKGRVVSAATRAKTSATLTGRPRDPEVMARLHARNVGAKRSPATREKMRQAALHREARRRGEHI